MPDAVFAPSSAQVAESPASEGLCAILGDFPSSRDAKGASKSGARPSAGALQRTKAYALRAAEPLAKRYADRVRLIFWDLLIEEARLRKSGQHTVNGRYAHPVWTAADASEAFAGLTPDFSVLAADRTVLSLAHGARYAPSLKGWTFLLACLQHGDTADALARVRRLSRDLRENLFLHGPPTVLVGGSPVLAEMAEQQESGALEFPAGWTLEPGGDVEAALASRRLVIDMVAGADERRGPDRYRAFGNYRVMFWDSWAKDVAAQRDGATVQAPTVMDLKALYPTLERRAQDVAIRLSSIPPRTADALIELGDDATPTQLGVMAIACMAAHGRLTSHDIRRYQGVVWPYYKAPGEEPQAIPALAS